MKFFKKRKRKIKSRGQFLPLQANKPQSSVGRPYLNITQVFLRLPGVPLENGTNSALMRQINGY